MLMHRFQYTKLTREQIDEELGALFGGPECVSERSDVLAGKSMKIVTDNGPVLEYSFRDISRLSLIEDGKKSVECGYGALTLKHVVFFSHMIPYTQRGYNITINQKSGLATVIEVWFCGYEDNREVQREIYYGYVDTGKSAPHERHPSPTGYQARAFTGKMIGE
jgi:hypothetical protein